MVIATISSKGQLVIPKQIREALGLKPQQKVLLKVVKDRVVPETLTFIRWKRWWLLSGCRRYLGRMIMSKTLNKQAVARWLVDQQALAERIQAERVAFLLSLTPERSLRIYLGLQDFTSYRRDVPSPVLVAMRQALCRIGETQDERASSGD